MARFDVYDGGSGRGLVVDCQANTHVHLNTRFVVPLQPPSIAPLPARKLNPRFEIDGVEYIMVTQFAASIPVSVLGRRVGSLMEHDMQVIDALDMLMCGY